MTFIICKIQYVIPQKFILLIVTKKWKYINIKFFYIENLNLILKNNIPKLLIKYYKIEVSLKSGNKKFLDIIRYK